MSCRSAISASWSAVGRRTSAAALRPCHIRFPLPTYARPLSTSNRVLGAAGQPHSTQKAPAQWDFAESPRDDVLGLRSGSGSSPSARSVGVQLQWLRDACQCARCVDTHSGQKTFASGDVPKSVRISSAQQVDGDLQVVWENDFMTPGENHVSRYPSRSVNLWLHDERENNYVKYDSLQVLWDKPTLEKSPLFASYDDWMSGGPAFHKAFSQLASHGILILDGVPASEESVVHIGNQIGNIQETFYGRTWDVRSKPQAENVAYTNSFLGLHQDLLYLDSTPRIQILHCLENNCSGGESIFSDSLRAVKLMAQGPQDLYNSLLDMKITYHYEKHGYHYQQHHPVIAPDGQSAWWSPPFQASEQPYPNSTKNWRTWFEAAKEFRRLLEDEHWVYEHKMKPGQCVLFNNIRVLHGRRMFDTSSGSRWLKGTYVPGDAFRSKCNATFKTKLPVPHDLLDLPSQAEQLLNFYNVWPVHLRSPKGEGDEVW